jgi:phage terminase large subunit-like protein
LNEEIKFKLTHKQEEALPILSGLATHICLFGGSRSGKTALLIRMIIVRALKAANSRHAIFRFRFNACKASIVNDTFPKIMALAFPGVGYNLNKTDYYVRFENGSEIWFGGLDDKERAEKILGMEFVTIYLNECSQIPQSSRDMVVTRLAQQVDQTLTDEKTGETQTEPLKTRMYYDANPPSKAHWLYKLFILKVDPDSKQPLKNLDDYASFKINPIDNLENLSKGYLETLNNLSARLRKRFLAGEFADATPNALFTDEIIDTWRVLDGDVPQLIRVVVAVDPSGSGDVDNADNDAIGIVVGGLGVDGNCYVIEDCTVKCGPATWGKITTDAYDRHQADMVVGEINYGGAMVQHVIQTARPRTPFQMVTATRGKAVRAEPVSALYEQGKIRHVGNFFELEEELTSFSTVGYLGENSPNRADALVWLVSALFPGIVQPRKQAHNQPRERPNWRL